MNSELIDASSCVRRMASARSAATGSTVILSSSRASLPSGIVSVTTSSSIAESLQPRDGRAGQHRVRRAGQDGGRPGRPHGDRRRAQRAGGVDHVVDDHRRPSVDFADDLHLGDHVRANPSLVDDGEVGIEALGKRARALDAPGVGCHDRHLAIAEPIAQVLQEHGRGVDVVDGHVEEPLDLPRVQVDGEDARGPRRGDEIGDELGADGHARRDLAVLARVAVVRDHRRDPLRRRPLEGVEHQEELHQVVVGRRRDRLDHEHVTATDVLGDLDLDLAVAEAPDLGSAQRDADVTTDRLRQRAIGVSRKELDFVLHRTRRASSSWAGRSRTFAAGSKVRCLASLATAQGLIVSSRPTLRKRRRVVSGPWDVNTDERNCPASRRMLEHARAAVRAGRARGHRPRRSADPGTLRRPPCRGVQVPDRPRHGDRSRGRVAHRGRAARRLPGARHRVGGIAAGPCPQRVSMVCRPARRHDQLRARLSALRGVRRAGARGRHRARSGPRPAATRDLQRAARRWGTVERACDRGLRRDRPGQRACRDRVPIRPSRACPSLCGVISRWPSSARAACAAAARLRSTCATSPAGASTSTGSRSLRPGTRRRDGSSWRKAADASRDSAVSHTS